MKKTAKWALALLILVVLFVILACLLAQRTDAYRETATKSNEMRAAQEPTESYPTYLSVQETSAYQGCECRNVKQQHTYSSLDSYGWVWSGFFHDAGIFPVLEVTETGYVKTVVRWEGKYLIIYFKQGQLTSDYRDTEWYEMHGSYHDVAPEIPWLCPNPVLGLLARHLP